MTTTSPTGATTSHKPRTGDWLLALALLVFFTVGYLAAESWPFRAALFPQLVSIGGFLLSTLKLVGLAVAAGRATNAPVLVEQPVAAATTEPSLTLIDEEAEEAENIEYVFSTAGSRAWTEAIGWIVVFFVSLWTLGVFVTVPAFAVLYLKVSGKASWISAALYAAITGGIIYFVFRQIVFVPMPNGIF